MRNQSTCSKCGKPIMLGKDSITAMGLDICDNCANVTRSPDGYAITQQDRKRGYKILPGGEKYNIKKGA